MMCLQIYLRLPPPFSRIADATTPHSAARAACVRMRSNTFGASLRFTSRLGRRRIHGGAAIRVERIFNVADIQVSGNKYPSFSHAPTSASPPMNAEGVPEVEESELSGAKKSPP